MRWEDDSDQDVVELEIDSLLNLANQYLMKVQLQGHYRSKSLDLIDFSNHHFYNGKLKLLPDYDDINTEEPAIKYHKVNGVWKDNINEEEALEVIDIVKSILRDHPEKEIGVVTFNTKQQGFIMDLLEKEVVERNMKIPESLFVKNIENVQGDERDLARRAGTLRGSGQELPRPSAAVRGRADHATAALQRRAQVVR